MIFKIRSKLNYIAVSAVSIFAVLGQTDTALGQDMDFSGKTIRMVMNAGAGSTPDLINRQLIPFITAQLKGNPKFIAENKPGGRGKAGASFVFNQAKPDGLTIGALGRITPAWALGQKMPVAMEKFKLIGARGSNQLLIIGPSSKAKNIDQMVKLSAPIIFGTSSPFLSTSIRLRMFWDMIGAPYKLISGYRGQQKTLPALNGGEIDMGTMNAEFFLPNRATWSSDLKINGFMQMGYFAEDGSLKAQDDGLGLESLPQALKRLAPSKIGSKMHKTWVDMFKSQSLTLIYVLPPNTPANIVKQWSAIMEEAYTGSGYSKLRASRKIGSPFFVPAATAQARMTNFSTMHKRPDFKEVYGKYGPKKKKQKRK
jgi:tripartite-type tricarboxylate transporter receptor subunit TctC